MGRLDMINRGFTERQYEEEFTLGTLAYIAALEEASDKAHKTRERQEKAKRSLR